jgi:hypothetical protein
VDAREREEVLEKLNFSYLQIDLHLTRCAALQKTHKNLPFDCSSLHRPCTAPLTCKSAGGRGVLIL